MTALKMMIMYRKFTLWVSMIFVEQWSIEGLSGIIKKIQSNYI